MTDYEKWDRFQGARARRRGRQPRALYSRTPFVGRSCALPRSAQSDSDDDETAVLDKVNSALKDAVVTMTRMATKELRLEEDYGDKLFLLSVTKFGRNILNEGFKEKAYKMITGEKDFGVEADERDTNFLSHDDTDIGDDEAYSQPSSRDSEGETPNNFVRRKVQKRQPPDSDGSASKKPRQPADFAGSAERGANKREQPMGSAGSVEQAPKRAKVTYYMNLLKNNDVVDLVSSSDSE